MMMRRFRLQRFERASSYLQYSTSSYRSTRFSSSNVEILPEVRSALAKNKPVVALESTILSHGLPYPENKQLSTDVSRIIRSRGAVPATIAVKDGICKVGLSEDDLEDLLVSGIEGRARKCSTRDLPFVLAQQQQNTSSSSPDNFMNTEVKHQWGATTVASTMRLAHYAGIATFVTGGTGGCHRGSEMSMDISADLIELSRTPVVVVSAGIKSILDIDKTLETLETYGVPTASYQTDDFPAFFSPSSGTQSPARIDSPDEVASAFHASLDLGLSSGMLIAVPNDDPAGEAVEIAIKKSLEEAEGLGIQGRDVTPFILKRVSEMTDGDSLRSNVGLVKRNAEIGADIAVSIAQLKKKFDNNRTILVNNNSEMGANKDEILSVTSSKVVVVGGAVIDIVTKSKESIIKKTSNPGSCSESDGGVGRNIAEVLGQLGAKPILFTAIGNDARGKAMRQRMESDYDIPTDRQHINVVESSNTATYLAILDSDGELALAIADMDVLNEIPIPEEGIISEADYLVIDANSSVEKLLEVVKKAKNVDTKVVYDPTSVPKAGLLKGNNDFLSCISFAFPNVDELMVMTENERMYTKEDLFKNDFNNLKNLTSEVLGNMHPEQAHLIVTLGPKGVFLASRKNKSGSNNKFDFKYFPAKIGVQIRNCTGAGDTMVGVFVKCLLDGKSLFESIEKGMDAAVQSLNYDDGAIPKFSEHYR